MKGVSQYRKYRRYKKLYRASIKASRKKKSTKSTLLAKQRKALEKISLDPVMTRRGFLKRAARTLAVRKASKMWRMY